MYVFLKRLKAKRKAKQILRLRRSHCKEESTNLARLDTFHRAIKPIMCIAQIFGVMPLANILHADPDDVTFRICTWGMCSTLFFLIFGSMRLMELTQDFVLTGLNSRNLVAVVFYWNSIFVSITFIGVARNWPQLIRHWTRIDRIMLFPPYHLPNPTLQRKLTRFACFFFLLAAGDHFLYHFAKFYQYRMRTLQCQPNVTHITLKEYVMNGLYQQTLKTLPYNWATVSYLFILQCVFTFIWNYLDIFIMLLSLALATRFEQFAARVSALKNLIVPDTLWSDIRRDHIKLCEFMQHINENLSSAILLSSASNLFFICNIFLNIFNAQRYAINYIYFYYTLAFQSWRVISVYMCAAKIHTASQLPLQTIYRVPDAFYTDEVQRFAQQINTECIALSGHWFYITRKSLFGLVASIVSYELMLLQLDASNRQSVLPDLCA